MTSPLPFFSLVSLRSGLTPEGLGVVLGRARGATGWRYAVSVGGVTHDVDGAHLIPLGHVVHRSVMYGGDEEIRARFGALVSSLAGVVEGGADPGTGQEAVDDL